MHLISDNLEVRYVGAAIAAGASIDGNSSRIDMADYESVLFVSTITDSVATGVATLKVEENDDDSDTGMAAVTDASATKTCASNDDINGTLLAVEYRLPSKRYVQAVRTSSAANIAYGEVIAILTPRRKPAVQGATVSDLAAVSN
ncbi:hypothetical protein [Pleomorphomonas oryzae]|uniref:hypothetical protein n=1 Tax=Pleomorphomonas oryzae TaxID=261934 RepID=UPI0004222700|nr:hypothetical protein [Pleomorphomonas oryzae]